MEDHDHCRGQTYNAKGDEKSSVSLLELTTLCREITGNRVSIVLVL